MPSNRDLGTLMDPENIRCGRVAGHEFADGHDRIRVTYEVIFESELSDFHVYSRLDDFGSYVVALLNAFGFAEGDLNYVADRIMATVQAEDNAQAATQGDADAKAE